MTAVHGLFIPVFNPVHMRGCLRRLKGIASLICCRMISLECPRPTALFCHITFPRHSCFHRLLLIPIPRGSAICLNFATYRDGAYSPTLRGMGFLMSCCG